MLRRNVVYLLGTVLTFPAPAVSVLPLTLDQMIDGAAIAFEGTCIGNRTEREQATNLVVTYTTFAVNDVLKGDVAAVHVIKQIGGELPEGGLRYRVDGVPKFVQGQVYVVLLAGVSTAGFSSPVGLTQGKFNVHQDTSGPKVSNGRDFREMTTRLAALTAPGAQAPVHQVGLDEFKQLVRQRAGGKGR